MSVSQYWTKDHYANVGSLDAAEASTVTYAPGEAIDVIRAILVTTEAQTAATATITVAVRDVDNGNSTTVGTFTMVVAGSALDKVDYVDFGKPPTTGTTASDGSLVYEGYNTGGVGFDGDGNVVNTRTEGVIEVLPGQEIAFTSDGGGDAGTYQVYIEYISKGFNPEVLDITANERTFTHA